MAWRDKDGNVYLTKSPKVKDIRILTEEELDKYSKKEWKEQSEKSSDDPSLNKKLKNLTGPKTEEGRRKALKNLRPAKKYHAPSKKEPSYQKMPGMTHGGTIKTLLNEEEKAYFETRMAEYLRDFEVNESSDAVLLTMTVMEEVIWRRLMFYQFQKPSQSYDKQISESQNRLRNNLKTLGMTREQRVGLKLNVEHSISELAARFMQEIEITEAKSEEYLKEEEDVLRRKREREEDTSSDNAEDYSSPSENFSGKEEGDKG